MSRRGTWLTLRVRRWLEKTERDLAAGKCGGDQLCPWCGEWMNQFTTTSVRSFEDGFLDEITCGNCYGTSFWKWEVGFFFITPGEVPTRVWKALRPPDNAFMRSVMERCRGAIAKREAIRAGSRNEEQP